MCVDISLHSELIQLTAKAFPGIKDKRPPKIISQVEQLPAFMFPEYPVICRQEHEIVLINMEWGVDPIYIKEPKERETRRRNMFNARSERIITDTKSYWHKLRHNRCLIPVSGTYEHRKIKGWSKKVPYYIWAKGRELQYIPGIYQVQQIKDTNGEINAHLSFAMVSRVGNQVMNNIHNDGENKHRMPLFLTPDLEHAWILPDLKDSEMTEIFNYEFPTEELEYHTVYTLRGVDERPDNLHKYDYWRWENLPPLGNDTPPQAQLSLF